MARMAIIMRGTTAAQGDAIRSAGSFANQMKSLKAKVSDAAVEIGSALLPIVTPLVTKMADGVKIVAAWIKEHKGLVVIIAKVAAALAAGGLAFIVLGTAVSGMATTFGAVAAVISGVGTAIGILGSMLGALLSPIGLVIAGVGVLAAYLITSTDVGGQALAWLGGRFEKLRDTALSAFQAVGDALAAGDISLVTGKESGDVQNRIDAETQRMNRELDERRNRDIFEREQRRKSRLLEIEGQRTGTLDELDRQREAEHQRRREQFAGDLQTSEDALSQARREWQQAIEEAARKRKEAESGDDGPKRLKKPGNLLKDLQSQLGGVGDRLKTTQEKISVTGTFNAAGVRGLAGGNPAQRTAKATEETAKNTKRILQEAQHGGLTFS